MKNKKNRTITILVLFVFITITYASFNTNLFIDGKAYVRADELVRITNIELIESTNSAYETYDPEYTKDTITINSNLPKQDSTSQYRITITNNSDYDYDVQDIVEQTYSNTNISYTIAGLTVDETVLEAHTTSTFLLTLSNNTTIQEEEDVYQTLTYTFDYTGGEQEFVAPYTGTYTLEVWGAQGGTYTQLYHGGFGGYSKGEINLKKNQKIYINVGGQGARYGKGNVTYEGGYNGGGSAKSTPYNAVYVSSGGGATHIATIKGQLKTLENNKNHILIVAGGGGGSMYYNASENNYYKAYGGSAGGFEGQNGYISEYSSAYTYSGAPTGGTQTQGGSKIYSRNGGAAMEYSEDGSFGHGGGVANARTSGGGGGYYGGASATRMGAAGGSGYIGNNNLTNKVMYCFECTESTDEATKTITTKNHSQEPTPQYAKEGNGYAKITITRKIEDGTEYDFDYTGNQETFITPYTGIYRLETWGAQGGTSVNKSLNRTANGGYGGYSSGKINLAANTPLYINVGGQGYECPTADSFCGGYNGGGDGGYKYDNIHQNGGGGATDISLTSGLLSTKYSSQSDILEVAGGGGGSYFFSGNYNGYGGSGGGFKGKTGNVTYDGNAGVGGAGGTQEGTEEYFGKSLQSVGKLEKSGGGGGYYGGAITYACGGGGSGYIGNQLLYDKKMYCYDCEESTEESTKTITTLSHSKEPKQNIAKEGNGYSRITLVKRISNNIELSLKINFVKKVQITYDYQYPYNYFTPVEGRETYTFTGFSPDKLENVTSSSLGKVYITDWEYGDSVHFEYDTAFENLTPSPDVSNYTIQFQGNGNVNGWVNKLVSSFSKTYVNTGSRHISHTRTYSSSLFENDYYTMNLRCDGYISGSFTISNIKVYRVSKDSSKIRVTSNLGTLPQPDLYNDEYEFTGWYDAPTGGNKISNNASIPDTNQTYYAHWNKIYNITYDLDGGSFGENTVHPSNYTSESETINISNPTKDGFEFKGWSEKNLFDYDNAVYYQTSIQKPQNQSDYQYKRVLSYASNIWPMFSLEYLNLEPGETYTLSFDIWADNDYEFVNKSLSINNNTGTTHNLDTITTEKQKLKGTFVYSDPKTNSYSYIFVHTYPKIEKNATGNIYIDNVQLEKGSEVTDYQQFYGKNLTINQGSSGDKVLKAEWKDVVAPTLSLTKETYIEGFDNWTLGEGHYIDENGYLVMPSNDSSFSPLIETNDKGWKVEFEILSDSSPSQYTSTNEGGYYVRSFYYDVDNNPITVPNGHLSNGKSEGFALNEWFRGEYRVSNSFGNGVKYTKYGFSVEGYWSNPTTRVRNMKIYGEAIPNSFYDISVSASDNVEIREVRYQEGSKKISDFRNKGTRVYNNTFRVTSNGIYTVYVADKHDNATVKEIEITNIQ